MAFTSGRFTRCVGLRFDGAPFEPAEAPTHVVGTCASRALTVTRESWDAHEGIVVGEQVCEECGTGHLYMRRPTKAEVAKHYAHLEPLPLPAAAVKRNGRAR